VRVVLVVVVVVVVVAGVRLVVVRRVLPPKRRVLRLGRAVRGEVRVARVVVRGAARRARGMIDELSFDLCGVEQIDGWILTKCLRISSPERDAPHSNTRL